MAFSIDLHYPRSKRNHPGLQRFRCRSHTYRPEQSRLYQPRNHLLAEINQNIPTQLEVQWAMTMAMTMTL